MTETALFAYALRLADNALPQHFSYILAELQFLQRAYPNATW